MGDVEILPKREFTEEEQKRINEAMADADAYDASFGCDDEADPEPEARKEPEVKKAIPIHHKKKKKQTR